MHIIVHGSIILILILVSKTIPTSRQALIKIVWTNSSCNLRVYLLIELLHRVDAQPGVLHRRIKVRHFLLGVQVSKIRNGAIHVH